MQDFILKDFLTSDLRNCLGSFCTKRGINIRKNIINNRIILVANKEELRYICDLMKTYNRESYHKLFSHSPYLSVIEILENMIK